MKIFGVMITGEPKRGAEFPFNAATNFREQTHRDLELIIINHGKRKIAPRFGHPTWINEIIVDQKVTLGEMRNLALDLIPEGSWWVQWDDDDWHERTTIEKQLEFTLNGNFVASLSCNMINYDLASDRAWQIHMCGIPGTIMTRKSQHRYMSLQSGEDTFFLWSVGEAGFKVSDRIGLYENNPADFIRTIHGSNTSSIRLPADQSPGEWRVPYKSLLNLRKAAPLLQMAYGLRSESSHA